MVIYSAILLTTALFSSVVFGFEYRPENKAQKPDQSGITAQSIVSGQEYCLIFEDHFDTFNLKNWQVINIYY
jgi:hypothetical protein